MPARSRLRRLRGVAVSARRVPPARARERRRCSLSDRRHRRDGAPDRLRPRLRALARLPAATTSRTEELPLVHRVREPRLRVPHDPRLRSSRGSPRGTPGLPRWPRRLALGIFLGTLAQAPLGALTVHFDLNPLARAVALPALARRARRSASCSCSRRGGAHGARPAARGVRARRSSSARAACVLVVSGTLATAAGPAPGQHASCAGSGRSSRRSTGTCARPRSFGHLVRAAARLARPQRTAGTLRGALVAARRARACR